MDQLPCPDGYLLDTRSATAGGHHALNQYMVRVEDAGWQTAIKEVNAIRDKQRKLLIWRALLERMLWLRDNNPRSAFVSPLRGLAERIEKWTLAPGEAVLIGILEQTAEAAQFLAPYTPLPHLFRHIGQDGLTPELAAAMRRFRERVYSDCLVVNQVSAQLFRSRLDMLAWRDEWTPVDLRRCWSEQIRSDFRAIRGAERENWRRLLYTIHGDEGTQPAPKWIKEVEAAIAKIGATSFRARVLQWFAPLKKGAIVRLSREGSYILRSFIWMARNINDPQFTAEFPAIAGVEFKPKANGQKVVRAAADAAGLPDPAVKTATPPPSLEHLTARALSAALSSANALVAPALAERIEIGAEVVHVRGELNCYEVELAGGRVTRRSDGRPVEIVQSAPHRLPPPFTDFFGVMEVLRRVLMLAEDEKNVAALIVCTE